MESCSRLDCIESQAHDGNSSIIIRWSTSRLAGSRACLGPRWTILGIPDLLEVCFIKCLWRSYVLALKEEKGGVFAPEEVYFPTMLALLGYLRKGTSLDGARKGEGEVKLRSVNYAEFVRKGDPNPKTFSHISSKLVVAFRRTGALFARKFGKGSITLQQWLHAVSSSDSEYDLPDGRHGSSSNSSSSSSSSNDKSIDVKSNYDYSSSSSVRPHQQRYQDLSTDQVIDNHPIRGDGRKRSYSSLVDTDNDGSTHYRDTGKKRTSDDGKEKCSDR